MTASLIAYALVLTLHSYARWALVLAGAFLFGACGHGLLPRRAWSRRDERLALVFVGLTDLQLVLGLVLYLWLSPIARAAFSAGIGAAAGSPPLWFFGFVHPLSMIAGFVIAHIGRARSKRATTDRERFRIFAITVSVWLGIVLLAMPWPWMTYGRPLLRVSG